MTTTRSHGLCPRNQAGSATDAQSVLSVRGGTVMIRRCTSPEATCASFAVMASICQLGLNVTFGRTTSKANSVNAIRSSARSAWRTTCGGGSVRTRVLGIAPLSPVLIFGVVVQQLGRSDDAPDRCCRLIGLSFDIGAQDGLMI